MPSIVASATSRIHSAFVSHWPGGDDRTNSHPDRTSGASGRLLLFLQQSASGGSRRTYTSATRCTPRSTGSRGSRRPRLPRSRRRVWKTAPEAPAEIHLNSRSGGLEAGGGHVPALNGKPQRRHDKWRITRAGSRSSPVAARVLGRELCDPDLSQGTEGLQTRCRRETASNSRFRANWATSRPRARNRPRRRRPFQTIPTRKFGGWAGCKRAWRSRAS
jgi:hypothetical protein